MTDIITEDWKRRGAMEERMLLGRIGAPGECVGIALFRAAALAYYASGRTLLMDRSMRLHA